MEISVQVKSRQIYLSITGTQNNKWNKVWRCIQQIYSNTSSDETLQYYLTFKVNWNPFKCHRHKLDAFRLKIHGVTIDRINKE